MIKIKYFSKYREVLGLSQEEVNFENLVTQGRCSITVSFLMDVLRQRHGQEATVFFNDANLIVAVNQDIADIHCVLEPGDEVAFFPPVTGG